MLEAFIGKILQLDPDFLVSHNLCGGIIEVLLARFGLLKVSHWSRIGRFKKSTIPMAKKIETGSSYGGSHWAPR